ncbi:MAG: hypothetical protein IJF35_00705 [Clostridia bacterium]|nr:hypothetical protein [Clostridia bacterium]
MMKLTRKNILAVLLALAITALKIAIQDLFNFIPLFILKWPAPFNIIVVILFVLSTVRWEGSKIDDFLKRMSVINIPLNIIVWLIALVCFITGNLHFNPAAFIILFIINVLLTITKIPTLFKKDENEEIQEKADDIMI